VPCAEPSAPIALPAATKFGGVVPDLELRLARAADVLRSRFGHTDFRAGQSRAVRAALSGRSALVVLPTGGGKSVCYQVPALVLDGLTVVVSPLIALMQDQVQAARARGIWAAALTSAQSRTERNEVLRDAVSGGLRLLYLAPERLATGGLIGALRTSGVALLAVDEAHCVSEWGHDFRPAYRRLGHVRLALHRPPTLALTATATPAVRRDITATLRLGEVEHIVGSFDRPNLSFAATQVRGDDERRRRLLALLKPWRGAAIVYVPTRQSSERWSRALWHAGIRAAPYHAGLEHSVRRAVQHEFLLDRLDCVVATSAFGMGIDKPNIRTVVHLGLSTSLEAYYQEAGRAGRDGRRGECLVLWTAADVSLQRRIVPDARRLDPLLRYLTSFSCRRERLLRHFGESPRRCGGCDRCERWRRIRQAWRLAA
jgi:ATP-dependent DNA helicase RecQ